MRTLVNPPPSCTGALEAPRFIPVETTVDIPAGQTLEIAPKLGASGGIELYVDTPRREPQPLALLRDYDQGLERVRIAAGGLRAHLENEAGVPVPVTFAVLLPGRISSSDERYRLMAWDRLAFREVDWILPRGASKTLTPLPPGKYRVEVELADGTRIGNDVTVRGGKLTPVRLSPR